MRLFDTDHVGCWLDTIGHRVEDDVKVLDLTLRVEPFTPELAVSLDSDVRSFLFNLSNPTPRRKIHAMEFALPVDPQVVTVRLVPELATGELALDECTVAKVRAKRDDGEFVLAFRLSLERPSSKQLEYVNAWHTEQRFLTFRPRDPELDFDADDDVVGARP
jgi:hypothetical protein